MIFVPVWILVKTFISGEENTVMLNNEILGMSAEKAICDLSGIDCFEIINRSDCALVEQPKPIIIRALDNLPKIKKYVGLERGERGGQSKSPIDFVLADEKTLSVKTNVRRTGKVCPSKCGQPGNETFDYYFGHLYGGDISYNKFKNVALENSHLMMPIYLDHLFDCDYLLWVYLEPSPGYRIISKSTLPEFQWDKESFSFTKDLLTWNESCTVKYNGQSIGEYQLHQHRNNYKFRFHLLKLFSILEVIGMDS